MQHQSSRQREERPVAEVTAAEQQSVEWRREAAWRRLRCAPLCRRASPNCVTAETRTNRRTRKWTRTAKTNTDRRTPPCRMRILITQAVASGVRFASLRAGRVKRNCCRSKRSTGGVKRSDKAEERRTMVVYFAVGRIPFLLRQSVGGGVGSERATHRRGEATTMN